MELSFEIDKITESIENAETGETLNTLVLPVTQADLKETTKKNGWLFNWKLELDEPEHQVYKPSYGKRTANHTRHGIA